MLFVFTDAIMPSVIHGLILELRLETFGTFNLHVLSSAELYVVTKSEKLSLSVEHKVFSKACTKWSMLELQKS